LPQALRLRAGTAKCGAPALTFYEFFAGGGMARLGLGPAWRCLFANDFDAKKAAAYRANFGGEALVVGDIAKVATAALEGEADLAWASFPCQDLSLAGSGAGLAGGRSGAFWPFMRLIEGLRSERRAPRTIVVENVTGLLTSHHGRDFVSVATALGAVGYRVGALTIDAAEFVPQSRPRLFFVCVRKDIAIPAELQGASPDPALHSRAVVTAHQRLASSQQAQWVWWRLPPPHARNTRLIDVVEDGDGDAWHTAAETKRLLSMMSPANRAKVREAQRQSRRMVGGIYRRTRADETGRKAQRAEVRFDDVAGCLRTPGGGSSRQTILIVEGRKVRSRLLSAREAARLMGLPEDYKLPARYNDAYHLVGDGVVVPVVRHLSEGLLTPLLVGPRKQRKAA
jgi:DNA (cytosine-5)-methyltransferase 1